MSLIEDYSREAVAEVLAVFKETARRMGEFQTTKKKVGQIIESRFGLSRLGAGRRLIKHVVDVLLARGVLELWDTKMQNKKLVHIYQVNTFALMNSGTRGPLVSVT